MQGLNYHHLLYFWVVVREGGLVPAAKVLRLSHPTVSAQIHLLEDQVGERLFTKLGRRLALTEKGRLVYRYADEIFRLGGEMLDALQGVAAGGYPKLRIGVADSLPKLVVLRLLEPALELEAPLRLVCEEGPLETLLSGLGAHTFDLVLSDAPVPAGTGVRAFNHHLGESPVTFFGTKALADRYRDGFPLSLSSAPLLLPLEDLPLRRALNPWFARHGIKPLVVGEFQDSALLKVFGAGGRGLFPAPTAVEAEVMAQYGVHAVGRADGVTEHFYAISGERRLKHPAVIAISSSARGSFLTTARPPLTGGPPPARR